LEWEILDTEFVEAKFEMETANGGHAEVKED
jgi:hypothetical protein